MTPNRTPAACAWPGCELRPSGPFCGRDRKRVLALRLSARRAEMPDEETLRRLPEMWQQHVAQSDARAQAPVVEAPAVEPAAEAARVAELEVEVVTLRGQLEAMTQFRDVYAARCDDIAAALGPQFMPAGSSVANAVQHLLRYVRSVEEEGGRYALLCQQAHDELDQAVVTGGDTPAERIRALLAKHSQAPKPEPPRSTELEQYLARQLLAEIEGYTDTSDPMLRPLNMLRAIVTGEVPRG